MCRLTQWVPDNSFPGGVRMVVDTFYTGLRLTSKATALATPVNIEVHLPSINGKIDSEELAALRGRVEANTAAISTVARDLSGAVAVRPATLGFGRVVDDTDPAFPTDDTGDGLVENMPRMTQIGGGAIGGIGGGQIQPDPSLTLDPLLGTPHYHAGRQRFVMLDKKVTPAPLDSDDDTGADPAQRLILSGEFDGPLPQGWSLVDNNGQGENHAAGGLVLAMYQGLTTTFRWDGGRVMTVLFKGCAPSLSEFSTARVMLTSTDGVTLFADAPLFSATQVGETEQVDPDTDSGVLMPTWEVGTWVARLEITEETVAAMGLLPGTELLVGLLPRPRGTALVRSLSLYSGWLFTALGAKKPDAVEYAWSDETGPLNEQVTDDSGTRWQPRTDVAYADSTGVRYTARRITTEEMVSEPMPDGGGWQTVARTRVTTTLMASPVIPATVGADPDISLSLRNADDMATVFTSTRITGQAPLAPGMTEEETVANTKAEIERLYPSPETGMTLIEGASTLAPILWVYGQHSEGMSFVTGWYRTAPVDSAFYLVPAAVGAGMRRLSPGLYTYDAETDSLVRYIPRTLTSNNPAAVAADMAALLKENGITK